MCVAKELNKVLKKEEHDLYLGAMAPDLAKIVNRLKSESHFSIHSNINIPDTDYFVEKYGSELNKPFELGYLIHLLTDKIWFKNFIKKITRGNYMKMLDGTILK